MFLVAASALFTIIGVLTFTYPPEYLLLNWLWGSVAIVSAAACMVNAVRPVRFTATLSGATIVASAGSRSVGIGMHVVTQPLTGAPLANYLVAGAIWSLIGLLAALTWTHYVIPMSVLRRAAQ